LSRGRFRGHRPSPCPSRAPATANQSGLTLPCSLRDDFPTEWSAFVSDDTDLSLRLRKDYFPHRVQGETLTIDSLELCAPTGDKLTKHLVDVPVNLADDPNGTNGYWDLSLPQDQDVLKSDAAQVFLIVRYSI
jgi:hypothetical protein